MAEETEVRGPSRWVGSLDVPDNAPPGAEVIAARIDLGAAEYHEHCCPWLMWAADNSLFTAMPDCGCGGPEMAKAYLRLRLFVEKVAAGFDDNDASSIQWEAVDVLDDGAAIWPSTDGHSP